MLRPKLASVALVAAAVAAVAVFAVFPFLNVFVLALVFVYLCGHFLRFVSLNRASPAVALPSLVTTCPYLCFDLVVVDDALVVNHRHYPLYFLINHLQ